jgi:hypothetical protein
MDGSRRGGGAEIGGLPRQVIDGPADDGGDGLDVLPQGNSIVRVKVYLQVALFPDQDHASSNRGKPVVGFLRVVRTLEDHVHAPSSLVGPGPGPVDPEAVPEGLRNRADAGDGVPHRWEESFEE